MIMMRLTPHRSRVSRRAILRAAGLAAVAGAAPALGSCGGGEIEPPARPVPEAAQTPLHQTSIPNPESPAPPPPAAAATKENIVKKRWLIVDAHLDIAYDALAWNRDLSRPALETRRIEQESGSPAIKGNGNCTIGLPDWLEGGVGIVFGTLFESPYKGGMSVGPLVYHNEEEAHTLGMQQLDWYHDWARREPRVRMIGTQQDLDHVIGDWGLESGDSTALNLQSPIPNPSVGIVPLMEGADPIRKPQELQQWVERGLRAVGLAWTGTRYSGGTGAPGGLTELGRELIAEIARLNVILDVSHMAQQALAETLDLFEGQCLIASHSNPQHFLPTERHLPDAAIKAIGKRDGVMGVVLANGFLVNGWWQKPEHRKEDVTVEDVANVIDYVCQMTGSHAHVGIGSDFDGGFGVEAIPAEFDTARDLGKIGEALARRGYTDDAIAQIMGGNWIRILRKTLK
jgi:membrane dipeptidase